MSNLDLAKPPHCRSQALARRRAVPVKDRYFAAGVAASRASPAERNPTPLLAFSTRLHSGGTVTEIEKLQGEIDDTLKEMAALNRMTLPQRTAEEVRAIRQHWQWCLRELMKLRDKLDNLSERAKSE